MMLRIIFILLLVIVSAFNTFTNMGVVKVSEDTSSEDSTSATAIFEVRSQNRTRPSAARSMRHRNNVDGNEKLMQTESFSVNTSRKKYDVETSSAVFVSDEFASPSKKETTSTPFLSTTDKTVSTAIVRGIYFIGERHSGTNWMFDHLKECFGGDLPVKRTFSRWKHWFQYNPDPADGSRIMKNSLVIAQFRDPYEWVEAMREFPYHAPLHQKLAWKAFVTTPWTMPRHGPDLNITDTKSRNCVSFYSYHEIVPCTKSLYTDVKFRPHYELRADKSGLPYDSIVDLRRDKILNFLNITHMVNNVLDTWPIRYEDSIKHGSRDLIRRIEETTGVKATCQPLEPQPLRPGKQMNLSYVEWMNHHVDWEVEALLGYKPREQQFVSADTIVE